MHKSNNQQTLEKKMDCINMAIKQITSQRLVHPKICQKKYHLLCSAHGNVHRFGTFWMNYPFKNKNEQTLQQ